MTHANHPMTQTVLSSLVRAEDGGLELDEAGVTRIRAALVSSGEQLGEDVLALVEIAYVVERDGHARLAERLRGLASEQTPRVGRHVQRVRDRAEDQGRAKRRRFEQFSGVPARIAPPPGGASVRLSTLLPPRPIMG